MLNLDKYRNFGSYAILAIPLGILAIIRYRMGDFSIYWGNFLYLKNSGLDTVAIFQALGIGLYLCLLKSEAFLGLYNFSKAVLELVLVILLLFSNSIQTIALCLFVHLLMDVLLAGRDFVSRLVLFFSFIFGIALFNSGDLNLQFDIGLPIERGSSIVFQLFYSLTIIYSLVSERPGVSFTFNAFWIALVLFKISPFVAPNIFILLSTVLVVFFLRVARGERNRLKHLFYPILLSLFFFELLKDYFYLVLILGLFLLDDEKFEGNEDSILDFSLNVLLQFLLVWILFFENLMNNKLYSPGLSNYLAMSISMIIFSLLLKYKLPVKQKVSTVLLIFYCMAL